MIVEAAAKNTLQVLSETLEQLSDTDYAQPCKQLSGASIGQHYRHILEIFECLINGYDGSLICYDNRKRDPQIESDREVAHHFIQTIIHKISAPDKPLRLSASYGYGDERTEYFATTYHRELAYALEHAVHHMAILKIGFQFIRPDLLLPEGFGVAASTLRHKTAM